METLPEVLTRRARGDDGERLAFAFLRDGEVEDGRWSYAELDRRARSVASGLLEVAQPGDRALLLFPSGLDFVAALFGCMYAGVVAVPVYPPDPRRPDRSMARLAQIAGDADPRVVLTNQPEDASASGSEAGTSDRFASVQVLYHTPHRDLPRVRPEDTAFLQYTSGSTTDPRGVVVSHANLAANAALITREYEVGEHSLVVSWLPLYHDMGLIGCVLAAVYAGYPSVLMDPRDFLRRPARWLRAMSRYRATVSAAPDFGYALAARRTTPAEREGLDLSAWRTAIDGAEPVRAETMAAFADAFAPAGFRAEAFAPSYGLAEATLYVSGGRRGPARTVTVDRAAAAAGRVRIATPDGGGRELVSCGLVDDRVAIVDPATGDLVQPDRIGEIHVSGPSVACRYRGHPPFDLRHGLPTGDLGFVRDGALYVTGRSKDVIVIRGACHDPNDIERDVERAHPALRPGGVAAFALDDHAEALTLVAEVSVPDPAVFTAIRARVAEAHGLRVDGIALIEASSLPKTSSGKVQRWRCREGFVRGELREIARSALGEVL
jgi:acyl-CoA synthetase (AMP-forming)/AMP-acid ligase II